MYGFLGEPPGPGVSMYIYICSPFAKGWICSLTQIQVFHVLVLVALAVVLAHPPTPEAEASSGSGGSAVSA